MKNLFISRLTTQVMCMIITFFTSWQVSGQIVGCIGGYRDDEKKPGWDRGYCSYMYCSNYPESWVRAKAELDRGTRTISVYLQLETDATHAGPMGYAEVYLLGSDGKSFDKLTTNTMGIGGKMPGGFREEVFVSRVTLSQEIVDRINSIKVYPTCAGFQQDYTVFNHISNVANDAMKIVGQFITISY
ncbi:MAG: hypothetical protein MUW56_22425 [Chryseobacterium sp.]|uniref:hypothetical protein n=1 Tax=Chryseobacterium sp. TaxID=1871047 RepID=UPI0025B93117|nr:hypothetical protein [Chryseobacterium sp.]MCJ7936311.1 hypothetical protein [Chryseobacterium sp.]